MRTGMNDRETGALIRRMRKSAGLSQQQLAGRIGVSYQQVQKYESGKNRLTLSRLRQVAGALGLPAIFFLGEEWMRGAEGPKNSPVFTGKAEEVKLLTLYRELRGKKIKTAFLAMLEDFVRTLPGEKINTGRRG